MVNRDSSYKSKIAVCTAIAQRHSEIVLHQTYKHCISELHSDLGFRPVSSLGRMGRQHLDRASETCIASGGLPVPDLFQAAALGIWFQLSGLSGPALAMRWNLLADQTWPLV